MVYYYFGTQKNVYNKLEKLCHKKGFNEKDIEPDKQVHIITLTNDKYKLLDSESYELYKDLLDELCDAS